MEQISLLIDISNELWEYIGAPVELFNFILGTIFALFSGLLYIIGVKVLFSDELSKWVLLGYIPMCVVVVLDREEKKILLVGKSIKKGGEEYTVWTLPQGEIDVDNVRLAFERVMERSLGLNINDYEMSREYMSAGVRKIADLKNRPINHPGFSIRDKRHPIGKGFNYVGKKLYTNGKEIRPNLGIDMIGAFELNEARRLIIESHTGKGEREANKLKQTMMILDSTLSHS